ncbi:hypothetical protein C8E86_1278 [Catellatospora citrea]|nr:hypothetical protein C8E86_1278 [Catellatospora citrea]
MLWLVGAALAFGLPAYVCTLWRYLPAVWRGELRRTPVENFRLFTVSPRSYLSGLLAITAWYGSLAASGAAMLAFLAAGGDETTPVGAVPIAGALASASGVVLALVAFPLTVVQWAVNAFNRPRLLVPPRYRNKPGSVAQRRADRGRRPV